MSLPFLNTAPARTSATRWGALTARHQVCADSMSLNAIATPAAREPVPVEERAVTLHRFGHCISGLTFSPGGDISMVIYDKVLQSRLSGKRHMEPIWQAAGWQPGVPVTRHEARLRRPAIHELGLPGELRSCLD